MADSTHAQQQEEFWQTLFNFLSRFDKEKIEKAIQEASDEPKEEYGVLYDQLHALTVFLEEIIQTPQ